MCHLQSVHLREQRRYGRQREPLLPTVPLACGSSEEASLPVVSNRYEARLASRSQMCGDGLS